VEKEALLAVPGYRAVDKGAVSIAHVETVTSLLDVSWGVGKETHEGSNSTIYSVSNSVLRRSQVDARSFFVARSTAFINRLK